MGSARNDGFILTPNEIETYRLTDRAFEYEGGNGFMITVDLSSQGQAGGIEALEGPIGFGNRKEIR